MIRDDGGKFNDYYQFSLKLDKFYCIGFMN